MPVTDKAVPAAVRPMPWLALLLVFLISLPLVTARFYASDEIEYFAYLRSLWFDGDLSFDNEYRYFYEHGIAQGGRPRPDGTGRYGDLFYKTFLESTTATGRRTNLAPIGTALLWAPLYVLTDAGVRVARALGSEVPADGFSRPYIAAATYGSALYGFLAVLLSAVAIRRVVGGGFAAVIAVWLGTPLLFYMYVAPGFSHACSAFTVAAFVVVWLRVRRHWSFAGVAALGALAALMGMVREQDIFIAVGPAVDFLVTGSSLPFRSRLTRAAVGALSFAICYLPQAISYMVLFGHLGPDPTVARKMTWTAPHAWRVLASPQNGLLFWTPLALLALLGLALLAFGSVRDTRNDPMPPKERAWVGLMCVVMVLTQFYVGGSVESWSGAGSFGQRRLVGLTVFFALGLASLIHVSRAWTRHAIYGLVVVAVWWNLGLIAQFGMGLMNRQQMQPGRNAYGSFITVPSMLPQLVYRYVFDRESFYQNRTPPRP
jgi:hypothetical protein